VTARLAARGLHAGYGSGDVLFDVDATFGAGRIVALLGENGSGKSTLLKALAGILGSRSGHVLLDGRPLSTVPRREASRRIGYLPQSFEALFPMKAMDLVLLGRTPRLGPLGIPGAADHAAAGHALDSVDAASLAGTDIRDMSGGERQRVLLARVLAGEPEILLLDEPTANLDPRHRFLVMAVLRRHADAGGTVVFSTHELDMAASGADDVALLSAGRLRGAGDVATTLTASILSELFGVSAWVSLQPDGRPLVSLGPPAAPR
jgi:iron complex transport system ATP-binding protein